MQWTTATQQCYQREGILALIINLKHVKRVTGQMATARADNCSQAEEESDGDAEWTVLT